MDQNTDSNGEWWGFKYIVGSSEQAILSVQSA